MVLAHVHILGPALARIFVPYLVSTGIWAKFAMYDFFALVCIAYDTIRTRRLHPAFAWGGLFLLVSFPALFFMGRSSAGIHAAKWLLTR